MIRLIRQMFCRHVWRPMKFVHLGGSTNYECVKCGKIDWEPNQS